MIPLDWGKAFGKLRQDKLVQVLKRLNIPEHILALMHNFYQDPKFMVNTTEGASRYYEQESGIRQGCPLSPYLFTVVMSAMFEDFHLKLNSKQQNELIGGIEFSQILYVRR
jgi:hypothetical protein